MKTTTIAAVAVVSVLIVGVLSLNYVLTLQPHVEITSFNTTGTTSGSSIGVVNIWFVLNLTNTGTGDGKNLTVTFSTNTTIETNQQFIYANSTVPHDCIAEFEMGQPCLLGTLKAEETNDFMFYWAVSRDFNAPPLIATVKSDQAILDQETIINVKITNFICLGTWHGTRLGAALDLFSLSYTNLGMTDIENLTVTLNTSKINETDTDPSLVFLDEYINGETYQLENLKAGETKIFEKTYFMFTAYDSVEPFTLTAILKFNGTILDQATITIPISG